MQQLWIAVILAACLSYSKDSFLLRARVVKYLSSWRLGDSWLSLYTSVSGNALECYVCKNQEGNIEKCLNTIKTCEQGEDTCLTEIKWGSELDFWLIAGFVYWVGVRLGCCWESCWLWRTWFWAPMCGALKKSWSYGQFLAILGGCGAENVFV